MPDDGGLEQLHVVARESFFMNPLEGFAIGLCTKEARPSVSTVQGMIEAVGFVGARRSGHADILPSIK